MKRSPSVTMSYGLSSVSIPRELTIAHESLAEFTKKFNKDKIKLVTDPRIQQILIKLVKNGMLPQISATFNKTVYDKFIVDLRLAANIDRKLVELLTKEALQKYLNHQKQIENLLARLKELRAKRDAQNEDQVRISEEERAKAAQQLAELMNALDSLDNTTIQSLDSCLGQIRFLQDKIRDIDAQKQQIYEKLGDDLVKNFNKPELLVNGKNLLKINEKLPIEKQQSLKKEIGHVFSQVLTPLNNQINKLGHNAIQKEDKAKHIEEKMETIQKVSEEAQPEQMLGAIKVLARQDDAKDNDERTIEEIAREANEELDELFQGGYITVMPEIVDGKPIYEVNLEVEALAEEGKELLEDDNDMDLLARQLEVADAIINRSQQELDKKPKEESKKEEEVQFGPPTFGQHLQKLGYKGAEIKGNIDSKSLKIIENKLIKEALKEKRDKIQKKIEELEKKVAELKKQGIISMPLVAMLKNIIETERKKLKQQEEKLEKYKAQAEQLKKEKEVLIGKFDLTVGKLVSTIDFMNTNGHEMAELPAGAAPTASSTVTTTPVSSTTTMAAEPAVNNGASVAVSAAGAAGAALSAASAAGSDVAAAGAAAAAAAEFGAKIRTELTRHPELTKTACAQVRACDAAKAACAAQIRTCVAAAADIMDRAQVARELITDNYAQVAGAPAPRNQQLQNRLDEVKALSAQHAAPRVDAAVAATVGATAARHFRPD